MFPHMARQLQGSTTLATPRKKNRPFNEQFTKAAKVQEQVGWGGFSKSHLRLLGKLQGQKQDL